MIHFLGSPTNHPVGIQKFFSWLINLCLDNKGAWLPQLLTKVFFCRLIVDEHFSCDRVDAEHVVQAPHTRQWVHNAAVDVQVLVVGVNTFWKNIKNCTWRGDLNGIFWYLKEKRFFEIKLVLWVTIFHNSFLMPLFIITVKNKKY